MKLIDPVLLSKWGGDRIRSEYTFTDGRVIVSGKTTCRGERLRADYLLLHQPNLPLAVIEAKDDSHGVRDGLQQAIRYGEVLDVPFVYSSNGSGFVEHDRLTGLERELKMSEFPSPVELWARYCAAKGLADDATVRKVVTEPYYYARNQKTPRYYQRVAVNRAVEAIARGQRRLLLVMATGTGKTFCSFQVIWRLLSSGKVRHVLYLADRNVLIDQTMAQDFAPLNDRMTKVTSHRLDSSYEVHLALYQQLVGANGEEHFRKFQKDFFDLVVIDECHRGSAKDDSAWRKILEYFNSAIHIGMTATPRVREDGSNFAHFGNPLYVYSLKQGIEDGFLAPYKVIRVGLDIDYREWRPSAGETDVNGNEIEDREYGPADFDRNIVIKSRTEAVARRITKWLKENGPRSKTIVFCVGIEHAARMRELLNNMNPEEAREDPRYVMRIVGEDREGRDQLDNFIDVNETYPVIATTSKLLTTGVDCKMCKLIALDANIRSMTEFKQIIGRGSRLRWDDGKRYFTIMDFRNVTRLFADREFDSEPFELVEETPCPKCGLFPCVCERPAGGESPAPPPPPAPPQPPTPPKPPVPVVEGPAVAVIDEITRFYGRDGKLMVEGIATYRDGLRREWSTVEQFRAFWNARSHKREIFDLLREKSLPLEGLRELLGDRVGEIDNFDLICHVAFGCAPLTRAERIARAKKSAELRNYGESAREVLYALLDKYGETGAADLGDTNIFSVDPFRVRFGSVQRIAARFGGREELLKAMSLLQRELYNDTAA